MIALRSLKTIVVGLVFAASGVLAQSNTQLTSAALVETYTPHLGPNGEVLSRSIEYSVNCKLDNVTAGDSLRIKDVANWRLLDDTTPLEIRQILWRKRLPNHVKLISDLKDREKLSVSYLGSAQPKAILVNIDSATVGRTKWGFGKQQAFDFNIQRLTSQEALYAIDHDLKFNILEHNLATNSGTIWLRALSLDLHSKGTTGSDDVVRNGTESSLEFSLSPFFFAGGLIYSSQLQLSYQIDTKMNEAEDKLFDVVAQRLALGFEIELPLTNYPMFALHRKTGYARVAMPLTLDLDYLFSDDSNDIGKRLDLSAHYELALSPYLIIQGEWKKSRFIDQPVGGSDRYATYYCVSIAQDLDAVKRTLGVLKFLLGAKEEIKDKHFLFFKISKGRQSPAFEDISERSFGFGTYF